MSEQHGNTGRRNAAKREADKVSVERFYVTGPAGSKARYQRAAAAEGLRLAAWVRRVLDAAAAGHDNK